MARSPNGTDVIVGERIRFRRKELGLSQEKLGDAVGITFQQIQKYEKGTNRIGAGRLQEVAEVLDVPVSYFFPEVGDRKFGLSTNLLRVPGAIELLRAYAAVSPKMQNAIRDLAIAAARDTSTLSDGSAEGDRPFSSPV